MNWMLLFTIVDLGTVAVNWWLQRQIKQALREDIERRESPPCHD